MGAAEKYQSMDARDLRLEIEELYADYTNCLDEGEFERWPDFFTDACVYKIIPRENYESGLPLATWLCESKGMLKDRVVAIRQTSMYAPRLVRRMVSNIRVEGWDNDVLCVRASYLALETLLDEATRVFNAGKYVDRLTVEEGRLKFKEKLCVFDSALVPTSLIFPL